MFHFISLSPLFSFGLMARFNCICKCIILWCFCSYTRMPQSNLDNVDVRDSFIPDYDEQYLDNCMLKLDKTLDSKSRCGTVNDEDFEKFYKTRIV